MNDRFRFSSSALSEGDAFERYRDLYAAGSDVSRGEGDFRAEVRAWRLDRILLFDRRLSGVVHSRQDRVETDGFDHLVITLVRDGALLIRGADGVEATAGPGEVVLFDTRQPWRSATEAAHLITVSISRDVAEAALGPAAAQHGVILGPPANHMLADYMTSLVGRAAELPTDSLPALCRAFMDILSSSMPGSMTATGERRRLDFLRYEAVDRYLSDHLSERKLSAHTIGVATGISRSSLYRLFEKYGGVARYIQRRRLDALRDVLDSGDPTPLPELAKAFGFADEAHMSRLFSEAYGSPPGAYRRQSLAAPSADDPALARRRWAGWMIELT